MMSAQNFPVSNSFLYLGVALWDKDVTSSWTKAGSIPNLQERILAVSKKTMRPLQNWFGKSLFTRKIVKQIQSLEKQTPMIIKCALQKSNFVYWILTYPSYNSSHPRPKANPFWKTSTKSAKTRRYVSECGMIWKMIRWWFWIVPHQSKFRNACEKENSINLLKVRHLYELSAFWMTQFLWLEIAPLSSLWPEICQNLKNDAAHIRKTHENSVSGQVDDSPAKIAMQLCSSEMYQIKQKIFHPGTTLFPCHKPSHFVCWLTGIIYSSFQGSTEYIISKLTESGQEWNNQPDDAQILKIDENSTSIIHV